MFEEQNAMFENTRDASKVFKSNTIIDNAKIMKLVDEPLNERKKAEAVKEESNGSDPKINNLFDKTDKVAAQNAINIRVDTSNEEIVHDEQDSSSDEEDIEEIIQAELENKQKLDRSIPVENLSVEVSNENIEELQKDMKKLDMSKLMDNPNNINLNIGEDIFGSDNDRDSSDEELKGEKKKKKKTKKKTKKAADAGAEVNEKPEAQDAKKTKKKKKKTGAKAFALEDEEEVEPIDISRRKNKKGKKEEKEGKEEKFPKGKSKTKVKEPKKQLNHDEQAFEELMKMKEGN